MKKQLLVGAFMLASFLTAKAQSTTYDFNALTLGNLGTDFTGETAGQGGWGTYGDNGDTGTTTTNLATNAAFQVVANDATHGNVLSIAGPNGNDGVAAAFRADVAWDARTSGNNVHNVSFDYYTGSSVANTENYLSVVSFGVSADNATTYSLGGFVIDKSSREVYGRAYYATSTSPAANRILVLGTAAPVLPENTWVKLTYSYNLINGEVGFKAETATAVLFAGTFAGTAAAAVNKAPIEIDIQTSNLGDGSTNTVATTSLVDNLTVSANPASLLSAPAFVTSTKFTVFPNPANNVVNVANADALINTISLTDINGRTVKTVKVGGLASAQINISDLASGVYMMSISSDNGTTTKKIVKN